MTTIRPIVSGAVCSKSAAGAAAPVAHHAVAVLVLVDRLRLRQERRVRVQDPRALDGRDVELDVADLDAVADRRCTAELAEDDAADGVVVVLGQVASETLVELLDREAPVDPIAIGPETEDRGILGIELVVDLADDLLE